MSSLLIAFVLVLGGASDDGPWNPPVPIWGDYDGEGLDDVYQPETGRLFRNLGNRTFGDVTVYVGVAHQGDDVHAAWADQDGDGLLDLNVIASGTGRTSSNGISVSLERTQSLA